MGGDAYHLGLQPAEYPAELGVYLRSLGFPPDGRGGRRLGYTHCPYADAGLLPDSDGGQDRLAALSVRVTRMARQPEGGGVSPDNRYADRPAIVCGGIPLHGVVRHHRLDQQGGACGSPYSQPDVRPDLHAGAGHRCGYHHPRLAPDGQRRSARRENGVHGIDPPVPADEHHRRKYHVLLPVSDTLYLLR